MAGKLPHILVITGPTASGKSSLAMAISRFIPCEIISADSRQVYRYLNIGTAKPSESEQAAVPHHCIDLIAPEQKFNAGDFAAISDRLIPEIGNRGKIPLVVGGTGLYVKALIDGFFDQPELTGSVRPDLERRLKVEGAHRLYSELQRIDPFSAASMDETKTRRVIRALEIYYETGIPISSFHRGHQPQEKYEVSMVGLAWERSILYRRINNRVDRMLGEGFIAEVQRLVDRGYDDRFQALQTVGYKEVLSFLRKEISYDRMVNLMKQNTRRFAKRQLTWFRREHRICWYPVREEGDIREIADELGETLRKRMEISH